MEKITKIILTIVWAITIMVGIFSLGFVFAQTQLGEDITGNMMVGCWKPITESNRSIAIRVEDRDMEEIIDTARHEICHEIYWRKLKNETLFYGNMTKNEEFAQTCIPEDYVSPLIIFSNITERGDLKMEEDTKTETEEKESEEKEEEKKEEDSEEKSEE